MKAAVRIPGVDSTFLDSSDTNAHPIEIASADDLHRHLRGISVPEPEITGLTDRFSYQTIKLERVDARAARLMKTHLESLGGSLAMHEEAGGAAARETAVIISGSRHTLRQLAARLKGEPFGLHGIAQDISACIRDSNRVMSWGTRSLDFSRTTYVMGILNCTPDSFFPGSRSTTIKDALESAQEMVDAGVHIIDVGGESTRPGSDGVTEEEEIRRVIPVIHALREASDVMISVDTRKKGVAERSKTCLIPTCLAISCSPLNHTRASSFAASASLSAFSPAGSGLST